PNVPTATLTVKGNGNSIPVGATTSTTNFTNFGSATSRTFALQTSATGTLYINSITFSGANAAQFSVSTSPASSLTASGISSFVVAFTPTAPGTSSAVVNILSNDCTNPTYS